MPFFSAIIYLADWSVSFLLKKKRTFYNVMQKKTTFRRLAVAIPPTDTPVATACTSVKQLCTFSRESRHGSGSLSRYIKREAQPIYISSLRMKKFRQASSIADNNVSGTWSSTIACQNIPNKVQVAVFLCFVISTTSIRCRLSTSI